MLRHPRFSALPGDPPRRPSTALLAGLAALLLGLGACTHNPPSTPGTASGPRVKVSEQPKSVPAGNAVWVLSTVGLNLRASPDRNAAKVTTVAWGAKLTVQGSRRVGADTWLQVSTESGQYQGWVLDAPTLVAHRALSQHVEQAYSNLFPTGWTLQSGNPATMTAPADDPEHATYLIQTADDTSKLPATPTQPGKELRNESPIDIYGVTTFLTVYKLDAGGFEYSVKFKSGSTAYLFDYRQAAGAGADDKLFKTLLGSVILAK